MPTRAGHPFLTLALCLLVQVGETRAQEVVVEEATSSQVVGLPLSFERAIELGIERNVRTVVSQQGIVTAEGERLESLAGLLPNISAVVEQTRRTANLVAVGLDPDDFQDIGNGVFGPFQTFDARLNATQTIFNLAAIGAAQAGKAGLDRARVKYQLSTHLVFQKVGETYVQVLEAQGAVEAFEADLALAEELEKDTAVAFDSGVATALDKARAESRSLASETRLLQALTQLAVSTNKLKALLMIPQPEAIDLTTPLSDRGAAVPPVPEAVESALINRPDIKFSEETIRVAGFKHRAAIGQQVPSIAFVVNYGGSGDTIASNVRGTYLIGGVLSVPLFDGGHNVGNIKATRSREIEAERILLQLVENAGEEVRSAIDSIVYSAREVEAAAARVAVSELALKLSKDRFFNGVSDNLELVAAQSSLANARNQLVRSLAKYNDSRIKLAVAVGVIDGFKL
ncbi:MAG: TolC family protein [Myxococcota bacterium]